MGRGVIAIILICGANSFDKRITTMLLPYRIAMLYPWCLVLFLQLPNAKFTHTPQYIYNKGGQMASPSLGVVFLLSVPLIQLVCQIKYERVFIVWTCGFAAFHASRFMSLCDVPCSKLRCQEAHPRSA